MTANGRQGHAAKTARQAGTPRRRASLYDEVTARILTELEAGRVPWVQPWDTGSHAPGLPRNAHSNRPYSGINIVLLWVAAAAQNYPNQLWLTYRQALALGGAVRRSEKGTTILYAARFNPGRGDPGRCGLDKAKEPVEDGPSIAFLKRYTVFNIAQIAGLPEQLMGTETAIRPEGALAAAEALITASGADIRIGGDEAYYSPRDDFIGLPAPHAFRAPIDYYRTALHELGHWTGHASRLARNQSGIFASAAYGREELCAELASAFICAQLGIEPSVRHADYIGAWLEIMRSDTSAIVKAASHASKAADYLLASDFRHPSTCLGAGSAGALQLAPAGTEQ